MKGKYKPGIGDIVAVRWRDHFAFKGDKIPKMMEVITWGKFDYVDKHGIAIVQSEVQTGGQDIERRMDTQFILQESILEIKKL
ncbi:hypothetical protein M0R04_13435 [Candidatus Dojkabacteria bacterium]|jgi:hypothetical protein|nr:hypothetical protein [Candidatus Dojkabacteria bacterium]